MSDLLNIDKMDIDESLELLLKLNLTGNKNESISSRVN